MLLPVRLKGFTYFSEEKKRLRVIGTAKKSPSTYHIIAKVPLAGL
jgi:hypothetical protein